jgi:hypothetical protein
MGTLDHVWAWIVMALLWRKTICRVAGVVVWIVGLIQGINER